MTDSDLTKYDWRRRLCDGGSGDYLWLPGLEERDEHLYALLCSMVEFSFTFTVRTRQTSFPTGFPQNSWDSGYLHSCSPL